MNTTPPLLQPIDIIQLTVSRHEHGWLTESVHRTSEGVIRYVQCTDCGAHRVDLQTRASAPPRALTDARGAAAARTGWLR